MNSAATARSRPICSITSDSMRSAIGSPTIAAARST